MYEALQNINRQFALIRVQLQQLSNPRATLKFEQGASAGAHPVAQFLRELRGGNSNTLTGPLSERQSDLEASTPQSPELGIVKAILQMNDDPSTAKLRLYIGTQIDELAQAYKLDGLPTNAQALESRNAETIKAVFAVETNPAMNLRLQYLLISMQLLENKERGQGAGASPEQTQATLAALAAGKTPPATAGSLPTGGLVGRVMRMRQADAKLINALHQRRDTLIRAKATGGEEYQLVTQILAASEQGVDALTRLAGELGGRIHPAMHGQTAAQVFALARVEANAEQKMRMTNLAMILKLIEAKQLGAGAGGADPLTALLEAELAPAPTAMQRVTGAVMSIFSPSALATTARVGLVYAYNSGMLHQALGFVVEKAPAGSTMQAALPYIMMVAPNIAAGAREYFGSNGGGAGPTAYVPVAAPRDPAPRSRVHESAYGPLPDPDALAAARDEAAEDADMQSRILALAPATPAHELVREAGAGAAPRAGVVPQGERSLRQRQSVVADPSAAADARAEEARQRAEARRLDAQRRQNARLGVISDDYDAIGADVL
jgi:hypothetical protein